MGRVSGRPEDDAEERALRKAFTDVKPLKSKSPRRVASAPPRGGARTQAAADVALEVEREANGIVTGKRNGTHSSILDSLEDSRLEVDAECDLHGLTAAEAEREVLRFVQSCQRSGKRWVRIVVGKGLHSPRGKPTLRGHIVAALSSRAPARFVLAFRTAPQRLGGTGALIVRLVDRL